MKFVALAVLVACSSPPKKPPVIPPVAASAITVEVLPSPAYIERTDGAQLVNCDLRVRNTSAASFELGEFVASAYDSKGTLIFQKTIAGNGVSPALTTIPNRTLEPSQELLLLNPIHTFPAGLELAKLTFTLTYERKEQTIVVTADVAPKPFEGVELRLPVRERVLVWSGHDYLSHHRRWDYVFKVIRDFGFTTNAGRYAYDLVVVDERGQMVIGDEANNESWPSFGKSVIAPAAGKVVAAVGDRPDDRTFDPKTLATSLMTVYGNHVVVEHAPGQFSVFGHLKQGSVKVKVGDTVEAGAELAAIGASGSAMFPHLHYQLQTTPGGDAEGLPSYFSKFRRNRTLVERGAIEAGELVGY